MFHSLKKGLYEAISTLKGKVTSPRFEDKFQEKQDKRILKRPHRSELFSEFQVDEDIFVTPVVKRVKRMDEGLKKYLKTGTNKESKSNWRARDLLGEGHSSSQKDSSLVMSHAKDAATVENPLKFKRIEEAKVRVPSINLQKRQSLHGRIANEDKADELICSTGNEAKSYSLALAKVKTLNGTKGARQPCIQGENDESMASLWGRQKRKLLTAETVIRLEERDRYKKLLEEYTSASSLFSPSSTSESYTADEKDVKRRPSLKDEHFPRLRNADAILAKFSKALEEHSQTSPLHGTTDAVSKVAMLKNATPKQRTFRGTDTVNITRPSESPLNEDKNPLGNVWTARWRKILEEKETDRQKWIQREESKLKSLERKRKERERELLKKIEERKNLDKKKAEPELPPLTDEMCKLISYAWGAGNPQECLVEAFNVSITRHDMTTLAHLNWLNDEIVNFYFNLLQDRSKEQGQLKMHFFNSFFYPKLLKTGYSGVRRWTKKIDIFSVDIVVLPVHLGMHWCLAAIDMRKRQIAYYDSLKGNNAQCISTLRKYIIEEHKDKKKSPLNVDEWTEVSPKDIPEQLNGCDCGVFTCKFAECITRDVPMNFSQTDMPYFRKRMVYEIMTKKLL